MSIRFLAALGVGARCPIMLLVPVVFVTDRGSPTQVSSDLRGRLTFRRDESAGVLETVW